MRGVIPPFPNTHSWRGAQLKKAQGQLYFTVSICIYISCFERINSSTNANIHTVNYVLFQQLFVLIAPHLLQSSQVTRGVDWCDMPLNHLDPAIFKTRGKSSKKKQDTTKSRPC
jgi:hypothetical protein